MLDIRTQTKAPRTTFPVRAFLLYGQPKVGKTTTAAQFPHPLILNVLGENGTAEVAGDVVDVRDANHLLAVVRELKQNSNGYQTVVLDGLSTLVLEAVTQTNRKDTRAAVKEAGKDVTPALHEFLSLPVIRVMTAHARRDEEEIKQERETIKKVSVYPDLPPRIRLFVEGRVDAFGYCYAGKAESRVWWTPFENETRNIAAGNRLGLPQSTSLNFDAISAALVQKASGENESKVE